MRVLFAILVIVFSINVGNASANTAVKEYLKEKSKFTGTVDIYDAQIDKVRNLKIIEVSDQGVVARDTNSGDKVKLNVVPADKKIEIVSVEAYEDQVDMDREFTDEEIQATMKEYFEKRSKITGTYMQYDETAGVMRNLKFVELDSNIRKFGKLSISTATFTDDKTGDKILIDVTVAKEKGQLVVKTAKIKSDK